MQENEILFQVSQIVSATDNFPGAVDKVRCLLDLTIDLIGAASPAETPHASFYAAPLRAGGRELGKLLLQADLPPRVSTYLGEQLGMLLERSNLTKTRAILEAELTTLRRDLATRKAVQRAQGILVIRRAITPAAARRWMSQRATETGLSLLQIAEQVVVVEDARRAGAQSRQRIA
jgi:hypothetical protein